MLKKAISLGIISIFFVGCSESQKPSESTQSAQETQPLGQNAEKVEDKKEIKTEEQPPQLNMDQPVKRITNLHDDKQIVKAVGVPVVDKEVSPAVEDLPAVTHYWFSKDLTNNLELAFTKSSIEVYWQAKSEDKKEALKVSQQALNISRSLLGDENGKELYNKLTSGDKFQELELGKYKITDAQCGQFICRYQIKR